jgi:chromosome segregation ATPase
MVSYPGRSRVAGIRARMEQARRNADDAITQVADLRRDVEGLRAEIKRLSIDVGEQLTAQSQAIEQLQQRLPADGPQG